MPTFPEVTTLIDTGTGADANPIGGSWATLTGINALQRLSNKIQGTTVSADNGAYRTDHTTDGPDCAYFVTVGPFTAVAQNASILARLQSPGSAGWSGYEVNAATVSGSLNDTLTIFKHTNGWNNSSTRVQLAQTTGFDFGTTTAWLIGIECIGTAIKGYASSDGGATWPQVVSVVDSTVTAAGAVGVYLRSNQFGMTNLKGGTIVSASPFIPQILAFG